MEARTRMLSREILVAVVATLVTTGILALGARILGVLPEVWACVLWVARSAWVVATSPLRMPLAAALLAGAALVLAVAVWYGRRRRAAEIRAFSPIAPLVDPLPNVPRLAPALSGIEENIVAELAVRYPIRRLSAADFERRLKITRLQCMQALGTLVRHRLLDIQPSADDPVYSLTEHGADYARAKGYGTSRHHPK